MKGVQCYELFGGIALKNHAFSFFKLGKCISILHQVKWTFDSRALGQLYYTLVLPYISYWAIMWGNTYYINFLHVFVGQKRL